MSSFKRLFATLLLTVAGLIPALHAQTQEKSYIFDAYGVNEGLSQSTVYNIIQDDQGFLWIATRDGINRFDGYDFNEYRYNPSIGAELHHGAGDLVHRAANGGRAVINRFDLKGYKHTCSTTTAVTSCWWRTTAAFPCTTNTATLFARYFMTAPM